MERAVAFEELIRQGKPLGRLGVSFEYFLIAENAYIREEVRTMLIEMLERDRRKRFEEERQELVRVIRNMRNRGMGLEEIGDLTGLSEPEIAGLLSEG
ncbi:MAG: hypothetical protein FJY97_17355 [candidate division Zixibacteria bacterium]|nr:hypothetical protein [candidate division Zixibacteria bacterium]